MEGDQSSNKVVRKRKDRGYRKKTTQAKEDIEQEDVQVVTKKQKTMLQKQNEKTGQYQQASNFQYKASGEVQMRGDAGATRVNEAETEFDKDSRAMREKILANSKKEDEGQTNPDQSKIYKGMTGYTDYRAGFRRENTVSGEKGGGAHGPLRASAHIRVSARFDYQPDICKDYKETGFCSYGDSCKFLHDRGDYKSGWELEKEWEEEQKRKNMKKLQQFDKDWGGLDQEDGGNGSSDGEEQEELPFACLKCKKKWDETGCDPIVTICEHYFCEKCALGLKKMKCPECGSATKGIYNRADEIIKKQKQKKT